MDKNLLLIVAQSCHKCSLLFHPHLWCWDQYRPAPLAVSAEARGLGAGSGARQAPRLLLCLLCAFLDV